MSIVDAATGALVGGVPRVEAETVAWGHDGQSLGAVGAWRASASGEGPGGRRITWLSVDGAGSWRESQTWELPSDDVSELARLTVAPDRGAWAAYDGEALHVCTPPAAPGRITAADVAAMLPPRRRPNASDLSLLETHWLTDAQLAAVWLQAETADQPRMVHIVGHGLAGRAPLSMSLCSPLPIGDDDHWCSAVRADHRNLG